jgi:hypothetical protein
MSEKYIKVGKKIFKKILIEIIFGKIDWRGDNAKETSEMDTTTVNSYLKHGSTMFGNFMVEHKSDFINYMGKILDDDDEELRNVITTVFPCVDAMHGDNSSKIDEIFLKEWKIALHSK